ncbi:MAG: kinase [bacterium]
MIITRTPFRISFFGGGTDHPCWYNKYGGSVLTTTIDKYCYISCRYWPPFFEKKYRLVYSKIELINKVSEIQHPSIRACLKFLKIDKGIEITHNADLPARTGLGSSSSFTVGLLNALYGLKGIMPSKYQLALDAIHVEQKLIKENVGSQDQTEASFGGFNLITFIDKETIKVTPVTLPRQRLNELQKHLMLFYTGISRCASDIEKEKIKGISQHKNELNTMHQFVYEAIKILTHNNSLSDFGELLHTNWNIKRSLTKKISNSHIDDIYFAARKAGAIGGKLLGAGGGGFFLIFAKPENQNKIKKALGHYLHVPFSFESFGSQVIFYSPNDSFQINDEKRI